MGDVYSGEYTDAYLGTNGLTSKIRRGDYSAEVKVMRATITLAAGELGTNDDVLYCGKLPKGVRLLKGVLITDAADGTFNLGIYSAVGTYDTTDGTGASDELLDGVDVTNLNMVDTFSDPDAAGPIAALSGGLVLTGEKIIGLEATTAITAPTGIKITVEVWYSDL